MFMEEFQSEVQAEECKAEYTSLPTFWKPQTVASKMRFQGSEEQQ